MSLSFVPDGTSVDGSPSVLFQTLQAQGFTELGWKTELLLAAQRWMQSANVNVGIVEDQGIAIGAGGATQSDGRFGDIRISARPLSPEVLAISIPPGAAAGTRQGDIILNSNVAFGTGNQAGKFDLHTVALQEFGHAMGIPNSIDHSSVMYEYYIDAREGLSVGDVSAIRRLYGNRTADIGDGLGNNSTSATATVVAMPTAINGTNQTTVVVSGDLTTSFDTDYYLVAIPADVLGTIGIKLRTRDLSGLSARLTVYDAAMTLKVRKNSAGPFAADLSATLTGVLPGQVYFVRIDRATVGNSISPAPTNDFAIGDYELRIALDPAHPDPVATPPMLYIDDNHANDTLALASVLVADAVRVGFYSANARFADATDIDAYSVQAPVNSTATAFVLHLSVRAVDATAGIKPLAIAYDTQANRLPADVIRAADGEWIMQVRGIAPGQIVMVRVQADAAGSTQVGNYVFEATFSTKHTQLSALASGGLTDQDRVGYSTIRVHRGSVMHFVLSATSNANADQTAIRLTLFNAAGQPVMDIVAKTSWAASMAKFLAPGEYTLRMTALTKTPSVALPNLRYRVTGTSLSDPIGPQNDDPDGTNPLDFEWQEYDDAYYGLGGYEEPPGDPNW